MPDAGSIEVEEAIFDLLLTTAHRVAIELQDQLLFEPVSTMGLLVLRRIARARTSLTLRDVAGMLGSSRAAATQLVDRMARENLVDRVAPAHDARARVVRLTEVGTSVMNDARAMVQGCMKAITRELTHDEKEALRNELERLERAADWHRAERLWGLHRMGGPGAPRRPVPHVR